MSKNKVEQFENREIENPKSEILSQNVRLNFPKVTFEFFSSHILGQTFPILDFQFPDFGFSKKRMIARLSFTDFNGHKFMQNIKQTKKINLNLISKFAPKIIEGTKKLKIWTESI